MTELTTELLERITIEALERTAFVLVDPCEPTETNEPTRHARINFTGPSTGTITVSASDGFLRELASSLLGVEPEEIDIETEGLDAIRELSNILGGSVLKEIGGQDSTFSLALPEMIETDPGSDGATSSFDCDGECLRVTCLWVASDNASKAA